MRDNRPTFWDPRDPSGGQSEGRPIHLEIGPRYNQRQERDLERVILCLSQEIIRGPIVHATLTNGDLEANKGVIDEPPEVYGPSLAYEVYENFISTRERQVVMEQPYIATLRLSPTGNKYGRAIRVSVDRLLGKESSLILRRATDQIRDRWRVAEKVDLWEGLDFIAKIYKEYGFKVEPYPDMYSIGIQYDLWEIQELLSPLRQEGGEWRLHTIFEAEYLWGTDYLRQRR